MRIRNSPRLLFLAAVAVFSFLIGLRTSLGFFFFLFLVLGAAALVSLALLCVSSVFSELKLSLSHPYRLDQGDELEFELTLTNTGWCPVFNLIANVVLPEGASPAQHSLFRDSLFSGETTVERFRTVFMRRGRYTLGNRIELFIFDPFGLFYVKKTVNSLSELYVYPRLFTVSKLPPLMKGNAPWFGIDTGRRSGGDEEEFFGIREYRQGDAFKTIHWVSTARRNKFIVKQLQRQSFYRATLIFNLERESNLSEMRESISEYIIRIAASVSRYLLSHDVAVELIAHTGEMIHIPSNKGQEHMEEILRFLTLAACESSVGFGELLQEFYRFVPAFSNLIVIMQDKDWNSFLSVLGQEEKDIAIIPVILVSSSFQYNFETQEYVNDLKVKLYNKFNFNPVIVSCGDDLQRVFSV